MKHLTKWVVITGAPSSGKTAVIEDLRARGYRVENEVARELIESLLAQGKNLQDIRNSAAHVRQLQRDILTLKSAREEKLEPDALVFMDRGMGDSITYFRLAGLDPAEAIAACAKNIYARVFLFDRLPLKKDNIRTESEHDANRIDKLLEEDYTALGYTPLRVPVMPIGERTDFILKNLGLALQNNQR